MSDAPVLPRDISPDGREIWGWADKFGDYTQRVHRRREVWAAIVEADTTCGSCDKWMTDSCPREVQDNRKGHKVGPSCKSVKCNEFVMKAWDAKRLSGLREEYAALCSATGEQHV